MSATENFQSLININSYNQANVVLGLSSYDSSTDEFNFRSLNITPDLAGEFTLLTTSYLSKYFKLNEEGNLRLIEFTGGYKPDSHEVEWINQGNEAMEMVCEIPNQDEIELIDLDDTNFFANLRFYFITIIHNGSVITFFRKYGRSKELLHSKNIFVRLCGDRYERLTEPTFQFDEKFDAVIINGYLYSFNKSNFQYIFRFYELLRSSARASLATIATISTLVPIANFTAFENSCFGHLQKLAKLRNIANRPYLQSMTMDKIRIVISQFNLQVNIIEENGQQKLVYDENDKWAILNLLDDAYLSSHLTGLDYEANSKRELQHL